MIEENNEKKLNTTENKLPEEYKAGEILKGKVTGITSFGAFVKLPDSKEGLVHISEIADTYVTNVQQYLTLGQEIDVKVLSKNDKGKYDLSIKQVPNNQLQSADNNHHDTPYADKKRDKAHPSGSFDELIDNFLKKSEEVQLDVRRNLQYKQGVKKKGLKKKKITP
jgi:S1 RNA binding domain protein